MEVKLWNRRLAEATHELQEDVIGVFVSNVSMEVEREGTANEKVFCMKYYV